MNIRMREGNVSAFSLKNATFLAFIMIYLAFTKPGGGLTRGIRYGKEKNVGTLPPHLPKRADL